MWRLIANRSLLHFSKHFVSVTFGAQKCPVSQFGKSSPV
jgi:hypothetical protein